MDWLVWRLCIPVSNHYIYLMEKKFDGFVVNKIIENLVQKHILKLRDIKSIHMNHLHMREGVGQSNHLMPIIRTRFLVHI